MTKKLSRLEAWKRYVAAYQKIGPPAGNKEATAEYLRLGMDYNFPSLSNKQDYPEEPPPKIEFKPDGGFATTKDLFLFCLEHPNYSFERWGDDHQAAIKILRDNSYTKAADFLEQANNLLDAFIRALEFFPPSVCSAHRIPDPACEVCRTMFEFPPYRCPVCGLVWEIIGEPSKEGTQAVKKRCYCEVDTLFDVPLIGKVDPNAQ